MNRRHFLGALLYTAFIAVASRLPRNPYGAVFNVVHVDPDGSGADYAGHLGSFVYNAKRCCKNCEMVYAAWAPGGDVDNGPGFVDGELTPVNAPARQIVVEIAATTAMRRRGVASFGLAS